MRFKFKEENPFGKTCPGFNWCQFKPLFIVFVLVDCVDCHVIAILLVTIDELDCGPQSKTPRSAKVSS